MEAKEAVATARTYFGDLFAEEGADRARLEEIWFDETKDEWCVTMGIRRSGTSSSALDPFQRTPYVDYKTIRISDKDKKVLSVRIRDPKAA